MRWLWMEKTQPECPWVLLRAHVPEPARTLLAISVITNVGDGRSTLFWTDRWINRHAITDLALALMPFVRRREWCTPSVHDALLDRAWERDIMGGLPILAAWQFLQLEEVIGQITSSRTPASRTSTLSSPSGEFSTKSAYWRR